MHLMHTSTERSGSEVELPLLFSLHSHRVIVIAPVSTAVSVCLSFCPSSRGCCLSFPSLCVTRLSAHLVRFPTLTNPLNLPLPVDSERKRNICRRKIGTPAFLYPDDDDVWKAVVGIWEAAHAN